MKPFIVDVPVRVNIWIRPECQKKQFEVLKQARPRVMFLQSDGGRNEQEWAAITANRLLFDTEVDWDCEIHRLYEDHNNGLYTMGQKTTKYIWDHVDRCVFLEDDYIPAVSFFQYCAELLEKYKDDERIGFICGNNVFETHPDAEPYDYFFTQNGWSIWGTATWRDRFISREFPLVYADNEYIKGCLKDNITPFWYKKVDGYCKGTLVDNHVPGSEYFNAINNALYHRLSIVPTKNLISNVGTIGEHANINDDSKSKAKDLFNLKTYELEFPLKHPKYIIDDVRFGLEYEKKLGHSYTKCELVKKRLKRCVFLLFHHRELRLAIQRRRRKPESEK